ncbi:acyltransferase 3 [Cladorrhinum sp. PSN332]|nr:acyltransferase 3 [Cladorrhinum sp. PSN332]
MLSPPNSALPRVLPRQSFTRFLRVLLPSFVADRIFPEHRTTYRVHPTSYLDGLRGIAAVIVFFCHYTENNFSALIPSYGLNYDRTSSLVQLPYLRIIFSGRPMVHIFFVISGFVLSYKPVQALHSRDLEKFYTTLASSTFRRAFRLFGPCVVSTFLILCLRQIGYLRPARDTLSEELWKWKGAVFHQVTWPWSWDFDLKPAYDIHLWTIPIEFAHSMLLFMVLLMLSRVKLHLRMASVFALVIYCLMCGRWAGFEFLAGLFLAEIFVIKSAREKDWESSDREQAQNSTSAMIIKTAQIAIILIGLFIGGWPNHDADKTPGIRYFNSKTPDPFATMDYLAPQKFWFGVSAVFMVWAIGELDGLKKFFEGPLAQYCGRISYAVYICHGPVMDLFQRALIGRPAVPAHGEQEETDFAAGGLLPDSGVKSVFGISTTFQITVSWFVGLWLLGPLVIWAADIFWRAVDDPIVKLGKRLEVACLDDSSEQPNPRSQGYSLAA